MIRAVGSLLGKGYSDALTHEAMLLWYDHFAARGLVGTGREQHDADARGCIGGTRGNPKFIRAKGGRDHLAECVAMPINDALTRRLDSREFLANAERGKEEHETRTEEEGSEKHQEAPKGEVITKQYSKRGTHITHFLSDKSRAFLVSVVVHSLHKSDIGELERDGVLRMTNRQIADISRGRFPSVVWEPTLKDLRREKDRWVDRIGGREATAKTLLRESSRGSKGRASEYHIAGLEELMALARPGWRWKASANAA